MSGPQDLSLVGHRLAGYTMEELIGTGGMATVYRALDQRLNRQVAVKVLAPQLALDERYREWFVYESQMVARLDHPHVIPIYEAGESDGVLFIAMRYVPDHDLMALLAEHGVPTLPRVIRILYQVAAGLDAAHERGLVHRDVKPANILVSTADGADHVYLSDFGLTRSVDAPADVGHFAGTASYVAPEQITGLPVTGACDLYALGCVAFELLTGAPPFRAETELALLQAHVVKTPPRATSRRPELPPAVDAVLARALAKAADERYATCTDFVTCLRDALSEPARRAARRPLARARRMFLLVTPPLTVVAVLAGVGMMSGGGTPPRTYPGSVAAPFSFRYPGAWTARTHADLFAVASPSPAAFEALLVTPKAGDWSGVDRLIQSDPERAQAVLAAVSDSLTTAGSPADMEGAMESLLPGRTGDVTAMEAVTLGGQQGERFGGTVGDPLGGGRLEYTAYLMHRPDGRTAYLVWFNPPGHLHRDLVEQTARSVVFSPAH